MLLAHITPSDGAGLFVLLLTGLFMGMVLTYPFYRAALAIFHKIFGERRYDRSQ
jgi:hypothetical protein